MPASTPEELRACIAADPQTSPSIHLADDSFAEQWKLTALGWKAQVEMAIIALTAASRMNG